MPPEHQLDLFDTAGRPEVPVRAPAERPRLAAETLGDGDLVAAISRASLLDCAALTAEAVRRRLSDAIPALEALCRRFRGFGREQTVPEQVAALDALAGLGGPAAAEAVARIITSEIVQGPGLIPAMRAAAVLRSRLPPEQCRAFLRHPCPAVRADATRLAGPQADISAMLVDLLQDLNGGVATAAACALGRMGRVEARPMLLRMLREDPSAEVIDAITAVADDDVTVMLGRTARTRPDLAGPAITALGDIEEPRAAALVAALRAAPR